MKLKLMIIELVNDFKNKTFSKYRPYLRLKMNY